MAIFLKYLRGCVDVTPPDDVKVEELVKRSKSFPQPFPVQTTRCEFLLDKDPELESLLETNINATYPLVHEKALPLFCDFLEHKTKHGTRIEKNLYQDMSLVDLVQRLFIKRSAVFCGERDTYVLLDGTSGVGGWEDVGKSSEKAPLLLKDCLSYDEMKLSALLTVSSRSVFINDGNRQNRGVPASPSSLESQGIIIGVVGARMKKKNLMDWQEVVLSKIQNVKKNGYGPQSTSSSAEASHKKIWATFYEVPHFPLYQEATKSTDYTKLDYEDLYFNDNIYRKRVEVTAATVLLDANARSSKENKQAYVHVVGFGLGVWKISHHQEKLFMDAFDSCFRSLTLDNISDVNFSWFLESSCGGVTDEGVVEGTKIRLHFSKRNPHEKLMGDDSGKLLVVTYAWDSNSMPGNEYWAGSLWTSGDPAAACSSQVPELQNPHINEKVSGVNLHVASTKWGVTHIADYAKKMVEELKYTVQNVENQDSPAATCVCQ